MITSEPRVGPILKLLAAFTSAETGAGWVLVMEGATLALLIRAGECCLLYYREGMEQKSSLVVDQYKIKIFVKDRP